MVSSPRQAGRSGAAQKSRTQPSRGRARTQRRAEAAANAKARRRPPVADRLAAPVDRADGWLAASVSGVAMLLFFSTFSSRAALGDAPESVAGVRSLGILHAPGYVTYTLTARAFGEVVRVGSWELRVNLFSLVCATLTVAGVFFLARCFGADKAGAAIGALALATSLSFWFNADFAKYYAFSTLLVTAAALCVLGWQRTGRTSLLVIAGALVGSSIGVSWQLALVVAAGLIVLVALGQPRPRRTVMVATGAAALAAAVAVCAYIVVRAGQDPKINFGSATNPSRLSELLTTADFAGARSGAHAGVGTAASNSLSLLAIIARDVGLGAVVLAVAGVFDVFKRRRLDHALFFVIVAVGNVVAIGYVSGNSLVGGVFSALATDGKVSDALIVVAVLAALGTTRVLFELGRWRATAHPARWRAAIISVIAVVAVVPSIAVHYHNTDHRIPPIGDRYARRILAALPPNSVFLAGAWEFTGPLLNRQVLYHDRPDVTVASVDLMGYSWYREQLVRRLRLDPALVHATDENPVTRVVTALRKNRPVYADPWATLYDDQLFAYQPRGLVARVVDGVGPKYGPGLDAAAATLRTEEAQDGMMGRKYYRFPNTFLYFIHERAHVELAKGYALQNDLDQAANEVERALMFHPKGDKAIEAIAATTIEHARSRQPDAVARILAL
jgi:hypothetical protein